MAIGNFLKGLASLIPGVGGALQQNEANKQITAQAKLTEAERQRMLAANAGFLERFGARLEGPQVTTRSSQGGGSSRGTQHSVTGNAQIVDPAQAALKAQLEGAIGAQAARPEGEQISAATKAASREQIAARERAMRETLGAAAAQRGVAPGSLDMLVNMPAQSEAATNLLNLISQEDETGRARYDKAQQDLANLLQSWKGSRSETTGETTQDYTNYDNSTMTDPNGGLDNLYSAMMYSPGAEQKPLTLNPWISGGQQLGSALTNLWASGAFGKGEGGAAGAPGLTPNTGSNFAVPPIDMGIFTKKPVTRY